MLKLKHIILIGFKASGKTTLGRSLSQAFGAGFLDMDEALCESHQVETIGELYLALGEQGFRQAEYNLLKSLSWDKLMVIATGGGVVSNELSVAILKRLGVVVYLNAPLAIIEKRLSNLKSIVLFKDKTPKTLYHKRQSLYAQYADVILNIGPETPHQLVNHLKSQLEQMAWPVMP